MSKVRFDAVKWIRMVTPMLASAVMIVTTSGDAAAKHRGHIVHHRCGCHVVRLAQVVPPRAPSLGAMRYYGGPKSPMWRAPTE